MEVKNSTGKLLLNILASFSEFERNTILENIYTGQHQRALEGYYQGNLPLGYNNIPDNKKELMINQHEANIVKYILNLIPKVMVIVKLPMHSIIKVMSLRKVIHLVFQLLLISSLIHFI